MIRCSCLARSFLVDRCFLGSAWPDDLHVAKGRCEPPLRSGTRSACGRPLATLARRPDRLAVSTTNEKGIVK